MIFILPFYDILYYKKILLYRNVKIEPGGSCYHRFLGNVKAHAQLEKSFLRVTLPLVTGNTKDITNVCNKQKLRSLFTMYILNVYFRTCNMFVCLLVAKIFN